MKKPSPPVSCRGHHTSYFQNDLRHFQAKVAKGYMTNSALSTVFPWVGSDLLTCTVLKGRTMGCQTLWFSIQNIIHFTIFCFAFKRIFILFKKNIYKIQPCPIPVLEKLARPFSRVPAQYLFQMSTPLIWKIQLGTGPYSFIEEVHSNCPFSLFDIKSL